MEVTAETVLNDLLEQIKKLILENSMLRAALANIQADTTAAQNHLDQPEVI